MIIQPEPNKTGVSQKFISPIFLASFPQLFEPTPADAEYDPGKYLVNMLIPKEEQSQMQSDMLGALINAITSMAQQKYGGVIPHGFQNPWRDGDTPNTAGHTQEHERGHWIFKLKSKFKPMVYDESNQVMTDPVMFHGGCRAQAQIWIMLYDNKRKGAMLFFDQIKKLGPGKRFATVTHEPTPEIFETPQNAQLLQEFSQVFMQEKALDDEGSQLPFGNDAVQQTAQQYAPVAPGQPVTAAFPGQPQQPGGFPTQQPAGQPRVLSSAEQLDQLQNDQLNR